jgi:hypothetical protein
MFRVTLANAFAKRTLRPLHEKHQATPVNVLLDSTETDVYSGMAVSLDPVSGRAIKFLSGTNAAVWGLFALDKNSKINDTDGQPTDLPDGTVDTGTPFAIWQGGPDAYFRVTDPEGNVLDGVGWTVGDPVYAIDGGKLADGAGDSTNPLGTVVEVLADGEDVIIQLNAPNYA